MVYLIQHCQCVFPRLEVENLISTLSSLLGRLPKPTIGELEDEGEQ